MRLSSVSSQLAFRQNTPRKAAAKKSAAKPKAAKPKLGKAGKSSVNAKDVFIDDEDIEDEDYVDEFGSPMKTQPSAGPSRRAPQAPREDPCFADLKAVRKRVRPGLRS